MELSFIIYSATLFGVSREKYCTFQESRETVAFSLCIWTLGGQNALASHLLQVQVEMVILSLEELLNRSDYGLSHVFSRHQKNKVCFLWIFLRTFTFKCKYAKWNFWLEIWVTSHTPHHFPLLPSRGVSFLSIPLGSHCCCLNLMLVQGSHGEDKQARRKWLSGCRLLVDPGSVAGCSTLQRTNLLFPTVTVESHSDLPLDLVTLTASVKTASHAMPGKCHSGSAWWDFHQGFWGKRRSQEWIGSVLQEAAVKQYWFVGSMQIQGRIGRKLPLSLFFLNLSRRGNEVHMCLIYFCSRIQQAFKKWLLLWLRLDNHAMISHPVVGHPAICIDLFSSVSLLAGEM